MSNLNDKNCQAICDNIDPSRQNNDKESCNRLCSTMNNPNGQCIKQNCFDSFVNAYDLPLDQTDINKSTQLMINLGVCIQHNCFIKHS